MALYRGHASWVHNVAFSSDGTKLVTASDDETVKIWTVDTTAHTENYRLRRVFDAKFNGGSVLVAVSDYHYRLKVICYLDYLLQRNLLIFFSRVKHP